MKTRRRRRQPGPEHGTVRRRPRHSARAFQAVARAGAVGRLTVGAVVALAMAAWAAAPDAARAQEGGGNGIDAAALYDQWCAGCHGVEGTGDGPSAEWMLPRPRDFTTALYQIRTTPSGQLPTDEDILRVIDEGMPGTTMPGWEGILTEDERLALVDYLKSFSPFFENSEQPDPMDFSDAPSASEERIAEGRDVYQRVECYRCHGDAGRGDGNSAPTLEDDNERPIRAADLTEGWTFNGGSTVEEIFRRMRTGLDGTPMPSQSDLIQGGVITEDELWSLAHYVRSLSPEQNPPPVREVIQAEQVVDAPLPTTVDDERWQEADRFYIPLVGQIIVEPRWFDPMVNAVWVQALHDGEEVALRLSWSDPSRSPDPQWTSEWQSRVLAAMEPTASQGVEAGPRPDRFAVQFPSAMPEGNELPYFLMGDGQEPVYLWRWSSDQDGATEVEARGMASFAPHGDGTQNLTSDAAWEDGQWRVLIRRPLQASEDANELAFGVGQMIPVAFFAWDGDNGEEGGRSSVSSWYYLHLGEPTPATVYVAPAAAVALTAILGLGVVSRAQKRERRTNGSGGGTVAEGPPAGREGRMDDEDDES